MNPETSWHARCEHEIDQAQAARLNGNEGKARVCARRAAGIIIGEYLARRGYTGLSPSAYERLSLFASLPDVDEHARDIARHFLLKVNPDRRLPVDLDLIAEAKWLVRILLVEQTN